MKGAFAEIRNPECSVTVGDRTTIAENIVLGAACRRIRIGFGCRLGRDLYIDVEELTIGDYCTIHHGGVLHGVRTEIGHNCWIGHYSIIDSLGGLARIGNNVCVGSHSQLWTHMKFGDVLHGCRWNSTGHLVLGDDVWLNAHSIVGPIRAGPKSMLMTGGVAVKDMVENHVYAGTPAVDTTDRMGEQFVERPLAEKQRRFEELKREYEAVSGEAASAFVAVDAFSDRTDVTEFELAGRLYRPRYTGDEYRFMRFLLYDRAKFLPHTDGGTHAAASGG